MPDLAIVAERIVVERGQRTVVRELDLELSCGEILALLGPNGSGKSSLLRALSGLLPYRGRVAIGGEPLEQLSSKARAARLSFVPQTPGLGAPLPVREVVAQGRYVHSPRLGTLSPADRTAIQEAMREADVEAFAARPFTHLSRGEQQRVVLARALCTGARILCLDEPTAALDVAHALELFELLRRLREQGYAIIVALHQLADALRFADRALLLSADGPYRTGKVADIVRVDHVREVYGVHMRAGAGLEFDRLTPEERPS